MKTKTETRYGLFAVNKITGESIGICCSDKKSIKELIRAAKTHIYYKPNELKNEDFLKEIKARYSTVFEGVKKSDIKFQILPIEIEYKYGEPIELKSVL